MKSFSAKRLLNVIVLLFSILFMYCDKNSVETESMTIASINPLSVQAGSLVEFTIIGTNFNADKTKMSIEIGGVNVQPLSATATTLTTYVPVNSAIGLSKIKVFNHSNNTSVQSTQDFTILAAKVIRITNISPSSIVLGSTEIVTITGSGFNLDRKKMIVNIGGINLEAYTSSTTTLTIIIPNTAKVGKDKFSIHDISTTIGEVKSTQDFTILAAGTFPPPSSEFTITSNNFVDNSSSPIVLFNAAKTKYASSISDGILKLLSGYNREGDNKAGAGIFAQLAWSNVPAGTDHLLLIVKDESTGTGSIMHTILKISPTSVIADGGIPDFVTDPYPSGVKNVQSSTIFGISYTAFTPPANSGIHAYEYHLLALGAGAGAVLYGTDGKLKTSVTGTAVPASVMYGNIKTALGANVLGEAVLILKLSAN